MVVCWVGLGGCDPGSRDGCGGLEASGLTAASSITTDQPLLMLSALSGADVFRAGKTTARLRAAEPLMVVGVAQNACDKARSYYSYGTPIVCEQPHVGDFLNAQTGQTLTVDGRTDQNQPMPDGVQMVVLGRWAAGEDAVVEDVGKWARVYVVREDALSVEPGEAQGEGTIEVEAHVEVESCSVMPPYTKSRWPGHQTDRLLLEPSRLKCGDGIVQGEICDDGNDDAGDGCEVELYNYYNQYSCGLSPTFCDPEHEAQWKVWRCEGAPSLCETDVCTLDSTDPRCLARPRQEPPGSSDGSARVRVFVNGRAGVELESGRGQVSMDGEGTVCGCVDSGWALACDAACTWDKPCARPFLEASQEDALVRWEGCWAGMGKNLPPSVCLVGNFGYSKDAFAVLDHGTSGEVGERGRFPLGEGEKLVLLSAVAAREDGATWAAFQTTTPSPYTSQNNYNARLSYTPPGGLPLNLPTITSIHSQLPTTKSLSPSADGQSVWALVTLRGQALFEGQPAEPSPPNLESVRRLAVHISTTGELWGVFVQGSEGGIDGNGSSAQLVASRSQTPAWSAAFAYDDPLQSELVVVALEPSGRKLWQQVLRSEFGRLTLKSLHADTSDNLWVGLQGGTLTATPFPELSGVNGLVLMKFSAQGELVWHRPWFVHAAAMAADGASLWTIGQDLSTGQPSVLRLRRYNGEGEVLVDLEIPSGFEGIGYGFGLWALEGGDVLLSRADDGGGLVLSRWDTSTPTLTRRWVERIDKFSRDAPVSVASVGGPLRVLSHFMGAASDKSEDTLSLTLAP